MDELTKARKVIVQQEAVEKQKIVEEYKPVVVKLVNEAFASKYEAVAQESVTSGTFEIIFDLKRTTLQYDDLLTWEFEELRPLAIAYGWPSKPVYNSEGKLVWNPSIVIGSTLEKAWSKSMLMGGLSLRMQFILPE
jgi:hypothetical protein